MHTADSATNKQNNYIERPILNVNTINGNFGQHADQIKNWVECYSLNEQILEWY